MSYRLTTESLSSAAVGCRGVGVGCVGCWVWAVGCSGFTFRVPGNHHLEYCPGPSAVQVLLFYSKSIVKCETKNKDRKDRSS